ncbi:MAG TPA: hypothetical protein VGJ05_13775 [Fimbriiglobus sp.]|jgi:hypothetical protein
MNEPLAPFGRFALRVWKCFVLTLGIVAFSLGMGTAGYHFIGKLSWIDSLYNASMILTGMGPVDRMETTAGKLFGAFFALYSGIAFLSLVAVILAPITHRFLHQFHISEDDDEETPTAVPNGPGQ